MMPFAQQLNIWNAPSGSSELYIKLAIAFLAGFGLMFALMSAPPPARKVIVATVTFLAGLFYVMTFLWPAPIGRTPGTLPRDFVESVGFWLEDGASVVDKFSNTLTAFLLGLGVYSILRIHLGRFMKRQKDWQYSAVLLLCMLLMVVFGLWNWQTRQGPGAAALESMDNWGFVHYANDLLFDGMYQQMEATMFSIIAFYILSAAYRAFRVRSVEATILLSAALIVILALMGAFVTIWNEKGIAQITGGDPNSFANNFKIDSIAGWIRDTFQTSSLRGISFGIGIGALAMGLRLWLSLERGGSNS